MYSDENDIMLLFAKISRFPLFENSGFLVETGSFLGCISNRAAADPGRP